MASIALKAQDGTWEEVGRDRLAGIVPEGFEATSNEWGSDRCSFKLSRLPGGQPFPDITAFADCEARVAGRTVWSGRVKETPAQDSPGSLSVEGEGWQYHLDDDVFDKTYVLTRISDFTDGRTFADASLRADQLCAAGQVSNDNGTIQLAIPNGTVVPTNAHVLVRLDLGPTNTAKRVVLGWQSSNTSASFGLYCRGSNVSGDDVATGGSNETAFTFLNNSGASGTTAGTFTTARRYVYVMLYCTAGATLAADVWFKLTSIQVFALTAYESGNASILKAPQIVTDAIAQGTLLLSSDVSQIDPTSAATFTFPSYAPDGYRTPRDAIIAANVPMQWVTMVDVDKRMIFKGPPTSPLFEVGRWSGAEFHDASANSGADIYNRVALEATGPDGAPLRNTRTQGQQTGAPLVAVSSPAPDNPSFATNTATWTPSGASTITRDTGTFDTTPAAGRWDLPVTVAYYTLTETFTGTFRAGRAYVLIVRIAGPAGILLTTTFFGDSVATQDNGSAPILMTAGFSTYAISWTPQADRTSGIFQIGLISSSRNIYVDSLQLYQAQPTIVDKRNFRRTKIVPIGAAFTSTGLNLIGDAWLTGHKTAALKGDITATGRGVRRVLGGQTVHPAHLLTETNQRMRLSHVIDPDTGALGREAVIAAVSYSDDACTASISLDNERDRLEPVLSRYAIVSGQAA